MSSHPKWVVWIAVACTGSAICSAQDQREWSESQVVAQERVRLLTASAGEVEQLIHILRQREQEGEGSRYDRVRAERELAEFRTDGIAANALIAAARGRISGFLPEGTQVESVRGAL